MTEESVKMVQEWQQALCENLRDLSGGVLNTEEQREHLELLDKSQKILLDDERMKLEREKLKAETEKLEYQKQQEALARQNETRDFWGRFGIEFGRLFADSWYKTKSIGAMLYGIEADQYGVLSGRTARNLYDFWTRPGSH